MNNILITGGSGFLGYNLIKRLYQKDDTNNIYIIARNENNLLKTKRDFPNINLIMGDIADKIITKKSLSNINIVYHTAAFKHVSQAEIHTYECIKSNIIGSLNLLEYFAGQTFIAISTDKAANPSNVYGATKFLMEKLIEEYQNIYSNRKYRYIRFGNLLYSTGSVLHIWKENLLNKKEIIITDPNATRFFCTADQAIDLIFQTQYENNQCLPIYMNMKSVRMGDLLDAMQKKYGKASNIRIIGLQKGEKLHEKLAIDGNSSEISEQYSYQEILELI